MSTSPMASDLQALREQLDEFDALLVETLGRRFAVCRAIALVKHANAIPMMQTSRVQAVKQRVAELAATHGVSPDCVDKLYDVIIAEACRLELAIMDAAEGQRAGQARVQA